MKSSLIWMVVVELFAIVHVLLVDARAGGPLANKLGASLD
jgi:hypothetical protein